MPKVWLVVLRTLMNAGKGSSSSTSEIFIFEEDECLIEMQEKRVVDEVLTLEKWALRAECLEGAIWFHEVASEGWNFLRSITPNWILLLTRPRTARMLLGAKKRNLSSLHGRCSLNDFIGLVRQCISKRKSEGAVLKSRARVSYYWTEDCRWRRAKAEQRAWSGS